MRSVKANNLTEDRHFRLPTAIRREIRTFGLSDRSAPAENSGTTHAPDFETFLIPLNVLGIGKPRGPGESRRNNM
jgi:hypothetical protein